LPELEIEPGFESTSATDESDVYATPTLHALLYANALQLQGVHSFDEDVRRVLTKQEHRLLVDSVLKYDAGTITKPDLLKVVSQVFAGANRENMGRTEQKERESLWQKFIKNVEELEPDAEGGR